MEELKVEIRAIRVEEYQALRGTTGWNILEDEVVEKALQNDLCSVCVMAKNKIVGMGRIIGDGAIYFYVQDIVVAPAYQKKGIGKLIMQHLESFLSKNANRHSFIGLMAAEGVKEFYYQFGYRERLTSSPGMFKVKK